MIKETNQKAPLRFTVEAAAAFLSSVAGISGLEVSTVPERQPYTGIRALDIPLK